MRFARKIIFPCKISFDEENNFFAKCQLKYQGASWSPGGVREGASVAFLHRCGTGGGVGALVRELIVSLWLKVRLRTRWKIRVPEQ